MTTHNPSQVQTFQRKMSVKSFIRSHVNIQIISNFFLSHVNRAHKAIKKSIYTTSESHLLVTFPNSQWLTLITYIYIYIYIYFFLTPVYRIQALVKRNYVAYDILITTIDLPVQSDVAKYSRLSSSICRFLYGTSNSLALFSYFGCLGILTM